MPGIKQGCRAVNCLSYLSFHAGDVQAAKNAWPWLVGVVF